MTFFKLLTAVFLLLLAGGCVSPRPQEDARPARPAIARIEARGVLLVGSTGDYRPLTWRDPETGRWEGFGIEVAERIAARLGVRAEFVQTSWPTLAADVQADPPVFDLAIGGITVTDARRETMDMSDGYLANGKTILCRAEDAGRFRSLADIDRPDVRILVNPGGLNEAFARANLPHARLAVHPRNEEIPSLVADGSADVMVTEIVEAPWYVRNDPRLAAPLLAEPFTHGEIGVLLRKGQDDLLAFVNAALAEMAEDGTLDSLKAKHGLSTVTDISTPTETTSTPETTAMTIHDFTAKGRNGTSLDLATLKGKVLLVVNTATGCGFTPQYEGLEKLYAKYHDKGLEILDFPCDQFGHQAPGTDDEIHAFCALKYNTSFDQLAKIEVNGPGADPIYQFLKAARPKDDASDEAVAGLRDLLKKHGLAGAEAPGDIEWNFTKFLIDREGNVVKRFHPTTTPEEIDAEIAKLL